MTENLASRLEFMEMGAGQRATLRSTRPVIVAVIGKALDRFYARAGRTPETARFFSGADQMGRAKAAQEKHWARIADANFDADYHQSVRRIGSTHARIGLDPRWYVGSYALVLEELLRGIQLRTPWWRRLVAVLRPAAAAEPGIAVVKAALLDMEISLSIYFEEAQSARDVAVKQLDTALGALASGNLTNKLSGMPESFATLERSYNDTLEKVRGMIAAVSEGTARLNAGIFEIAQASEDLARRTEGNAASLEQTNAAITQMDGRLRTSADAARSTVARADQAIATVGEGRSVADEAVQAMSRVAGSAQGIDDVIEGLDKIAFQTRVLAMNAAVEAGRAGEAGRGFAVVADLVSALAMRAEEEARRAREQLSATQSEIGIAVEAVQKVDGALANISGDVSQVHLLLASMADDNAAQAAAIGEVSSSIGSMDRATQQNAAMVEQTSAAARTLSGEVSTLAELTSSFQVADGAAMAPAGLPAFAGPVKSLPAAAVTALRRPG